MFRLFTDAGSGLWQTPWCVESSPAPTPAPPLPQHFLIVGWFDCLRAAKKEKEELMKSLVGVGGWRW